MNQWLAAREAYVTYHVIHQPPVGGAQPQPQAEELLQVPHLKAKSTCEST
jgi:hypothetical protein